MATYVGIPALKQNLFHYGRGGRVSLQDDTVKLKDAKIEGIEYLGVSVQGI